MNKKIIALLVLFISIKGISQKTVSEKVTYNVYNYKCYHCGKAKKKTVIDVMSIKDKDVSKKVSEEAFENGYSQGNSVLDAIVGYSDEDNTTCNGSRNGRHSYNEINHTTTTKIVSAESGKVAKQEQELKNQKAVEFKKKIYNIFYNYNKAYWLDKTELDEISKRECESFLKKYDSKKWDDMEKSESDKIIYDIVRQFTYTQNPNRTKAIDIGSEAWKLYGNKSFDSCISLSKQALTYYDTLPFIYANIGLCYLAKGENSFTKETYDNLKQQEFVKYYQKAVNYSYLDKNLDFAIYGIDGMIKDLDDLLVQYFSFDKNDSYTSIIKAMRSSLKTQRENLGTKVIVP